MSLSYEERMNRLEDVAQNGNLGDLIELYKEVFGEEYPQTYSRNPSEDFNAIIDAIELNKKVKDPKIPKNMDL